MMRVLPFLSAGVREHDAGSHHRQRFVDTGNFASRVFGALLHEEVCLVIVRPGPMSDTLSRYC